VAAMPLANGGGYSNPTGGGGGAAKKNEPFDLRQFAEMPRVKHSNQLVTGTEIGYFVIITLAVILLYIVLVGGLCFSVLALTI
jgi:hypothetical protein